MQSPTFGGIAGGTEQRLFRMLTAVQIKSAKPTSRAYKLSDSGGLFLLIQPGGSKLWRYKFRIGGVEGMHALGTFPEIGLAEAREAHTHARKLVAQGINPVHARKEKKLALAQAQLSRDKGAFSTVLTEWSATEEINLSANTVKQRRREFKKHLLPAFGNRQINSITRVELTKLLKSNEERTPEVARNLRNYLWSTFEYAINTGLVTSNPVPPLQVLKKRKQKNHPALSPEELGNFLRELDAAAHVNELTRIAAKLVALNTARKAEVIEAPWTEIDLVKGMWEIPAERMKPRRPHCIPLSKQSLTLLKKLRAMTPDDQEYLFPNRRDPKRPMANRTLNALMARLGFSGIGTPHGLRASFSTRFNEEYAGGNAQAKAGKEAVEYCLSHMPMGMTRAAYNRYAYMKERKTILQEWADYLDKLKDSKTEPLKQAA